MVGDKLSPGFKQMKLCLHSKDSKYMCYNFDNWHFKNLTNSTKFSKHEIYLIRKKINLTLASRDSLGRDRMEVGFTTTCTITAYHHLESHTWRGVLDTTLCVKFCQWLATGWWFSPGPLVSSTDKTDRQDITEILFKVALNTITLTIHWHLKWKKTIIYV